MSCFPSVLVVVAHADNMLQGSTWPSTACELDDNKTLLECLCTAVRFVCTGQRIRHIRHVVRHQVTTDNHSSPACNICCSGGNARASWDYCDIQFATTFSIWVFRGQHSPVKCLQHSSCCLSCQFLVTRTGRHPAKCLVPSWTGELLGV